MRIAVVLFFFALSPAALAGRETHDCAALLEKSPDFWRQVQRELQHDLHYPERLLEQLRLEPSELVRGTRLGHGTSGDVYADVWRNQAVATKVYRKKRHSIDDGHEFYKTLALQKALGNLGLSPTLLGAYWTLEGEKGVVMERIPAVAVSFTYAQEVPAARRRQNELVIRTQALQMGEILRHLKLMPGDIQCLVCQDGKIYLHDFDDYIYDPDSPSLPRLVESGIHALLLALEKKDPWSNRLFELLSSVQR